MKDKFVIIGGGISGLSTARMLTDKGYEVTVYEADEKPGGLIKCREFDNVLYHTVGGHVFNSKRSDVLEWFGKIFSQEKEFTSAIRNAVAYFEKPINYPIENHLYEFEGSVVNQVISELIELEKTNTSSPLNFEEFLKQRFGNTLYELYFRPYNEKIWKKSLSNVPLSWLEGKLPMPTFHEIVYNNIVREKEMHMVHSSFFYPLKGGSQFLANRLAEGLDIRYSSEVTSITKEGQRWLINGDEYADQIVYCGNIVTLPDIVQEKFDDELRDKINSLEYHGTTSVLCAIQDNPYSWIYLPNPNYPAHRIIMTGNFSTNNNGKYAKTCTLEFTDYVDETTINETLAQLPFQPRYLTHQYTQYTYPIQTSNTRSTIQSVRERLSESNIHLIGRFAEWEYYNMDAAMGAAMDYVNTHF